MPKRRKIKQKLLSASSELRKGFVMPSQKRIVSILRANSKAFVIRMFMSAFSLLTKTDKIKVLIKIERGAVKKIGNSIRRKRIKGRRKKSRGKKRDRRKSKSKRKGKKVSFVPKSGPRKGKRVTFFVKG